MSSLSARRAYSFVPESQAPTNDEPTRAVAPAKQPASGQFGMVFSQWLALGLPAPAVVVLSCLASRTNYDRHDGMSYWSVDELLTATKLSRPTLFRAITALKKSHVLEHRTHTKSYRLVKPDVDGAQLEALDGGAKTPRKRRVKVSPMTFQSLTGETSPSQSLTGETSIQTDIGLNIQQQQTTAVVVNSNSPRDEIIERLQLVGFSETDAEQLVDAHNLPALLEGLSALKAARNVRNGPGWLRAALRGAWKPPVDPQVTARHATATPNAPDPWDVIWPELDRFCDLTTIAVEWYDDAHAGDVLTLKIPPAAFVSHARWLIDFVTAHGDDELPEKKGCYCASCRSKRDRVVS